MRTPEEQEQFLNEGRFQPTSANREFSSRWLISLLVLLFPLPFSPWWLSAICLGLFGGLAYMIIRPRKT